MSQTGPSTPGFNFNPGALEHAKAMRSFYETSLRYLQAEIKDLEAQIKDKMKDFSFNESETIRNSVDQYRKLTALEKEQRYLQLVLEELNLNDGELSEEAHERIRLEVLDEQNDALRDKTIQTQGLDLDQDVEVLRTSLKPTYLVFSSLIHPDMNQDVDKDTAKIYSQAFANLQQFYNSDNILGVGAFKSKIIPKFIQVLEAKLKINSLSSIDQETPEYYENLKKEIKSLMSTSDSTKDNVRTTLIKALTLGQVPADLKTNEDLYLETIKLQETKKELELILNAINEGKTELEINEMLGSQKTLDTAKEIEIQQLELENQKLKDEIATVRAKFQKEKVDKLNQSLYPQDTLTIPVQPNQDQNLVVPESDLSLENQIEKDKKDWEKAKVVLGKFTEDLIDGRFGIPTHQNGRYFVAIKGYILSIIPSEGKIFFNNFKTNEYLNLSTGNSFDDTSIVSLNMDTRYINEQYQTSIKTDKNIQFSNYHTVSFSTAFESVKKDLQRVFGIDIDELYGNGNPLEGDATKSTDKIKPKVGMLARIKQIIKPKANQAETKPELVVSSAENSLEMKKNKWNPTNMEEAMACIKELQGVIEKASGVIKSKNSYEYQSSEEDEYLLQTKNKALSIKFRFLSTNNGIHLQTQAIHNSFTDVYSYRRKDYTSNIRNLSIGYFGNDLDVYDFDKEYSNEDSIGKVFNSLKNTLKEFGVDLDNIS
jgi:hypothetical protein